jgi:hypothetical protein
MEYARHDSVATFTMAISLPLPSVLYLQFLDSPCTSWDKWTIMHIMVSEKGIFCVRFEAFTVVLLKIQVGYDAVPVGEYCLMFQSIILPSS